MSGQYLIDLILRGFFRRVVLNTYKQNKDNHSWKIYQIDCF